MDYHRLGQALRDARKHQGYTQIALKTLLNCSQSQISELEQGIPNAVSRELLDRIAAHLGIDLAEYERTAPSSAAEPSRFAFCANQSCPAARPFVVNGSPRMKPHFVALASGANNCEFCGDVLADRCQQDGCGHPVHPGFFCRGCARPYVELPTSIRDAASAERKARQVDEFLRQFEA